jgi:hypothetical protein
VLGLDRTSVAVGEPFHLTLTTELGDRLSAVDSIVLPNLSGFEDLGDERRCATSKSGGTQCVETLTLDATSPGDRTIGPAALAAIEPGSGRAHTVESNVVTIHVTGQAKANATTEPEPAPDDPLADALQNALRQVGIFLLVAIAVWALLWGFGRRRVARPPALQAPPPKVEAPLASEPDWAAEIARLGAELEREPTRARAVAVREALRRHVGAREEETLADLIARNATNGHTNTLAALAAVERAAFCEESRVPEAVREALPYLKG